MEHESGSAAKRSRAETSATYSYRKDPTVPFFSDQHPIIVYDGLCALCSGWVSIVLRYDHRRRFRLVPAQAPLGQALYRHYGLDPENFESNMLIEEGEVWLKSEACLRRWRDRAYDHLARRRLRFGRRKTCFLGNEDQRDRFLV